MNISLPKTLGLALSLLVPCSVAYAEVQRPSALPKQNDASPVIGANPHIDIATDIPFMASLITNIVGENDRVTSLVTASDSPHTFAFRPSTMRSIQNADLVVFIGEQFMPAVVNAVKEVTSDSQMLTLLDLDGITLYRSTEKDQHHEHDDKPEHNVFADPHLWTDPLNLHVVAGAIRDRLIAIDPARQASFTANTDRVLANLDTFNTEQLRRWQSTKAVAFVSMHDTTRYFTERYGLHPVDVLFSAQHSSPGVKQLRAFQKAVQQANVACVLTDPNTNSKWTQPFNDATGVTVAMVDALGVTTPDANYLSVLNTMSDTLHSCITRR